MSKQTMMDLETHVSNEELEDLYNSIGLIYEFDSLDNYENSNAIRIC